MTLQKAASDAQYQLWDHLREGFLDYRGGNQAAARAVFGRLLEVLRPYFRLRLSSKEEAEDMAQATLLKIHLSRDRFAAERSLKTWVYTIASRCLIDHWRGTKQRGDLGYDEDAAELAAAEAAPDLPHDLRLVYSTELETALATLKPIDRAIVYLCGVEGLSLAEVATMHAMSAGAAKVRVHRSYVKLRAILSREEV